MTDPHNYHPTQCFPWALQRFFSLFLLIVFSPTTLQFWFSFTALIKLVFSRKTHRTLITQHQNDPQTKLATTQQLESQTFSQELAYTKSGLQLDFHQMDTNSTSNEIQSEHARSNEIQKESTCRTLCRHVVITRVLFDASHLSLEIWPYIVVPSLDHQLNLWA